MLPEELLKPRYELIADFPGNTRPVGFVFVMDSEDSEGRYTTTGYLLESFFTQYPHLFKPLEWWEERKIEDMPGYLRVVITDFIKFTKGQIIRVEKHKSNSFNQIVPSLFISNDKQGPPPHPDCFCYKDFLPATEAEYNAYLNTK